MSQSRLRTQLCVCGRMLLTAALLALVVSPVAAQSGRRGIEPRTSANTAGKGFGTYHALIFAVGDQQPSSGLPSLRFPLKEADSLRAVITREYTFDPANVQVVRNPTREAILDSLESVARRLGAEDNLLVVYSGHGGFDEAGREGYWLAADAANARKSTWIPNESIRTWLRTLKARSVLLITDACFSGSLNRSNDDRVTLAADRRMAIEGALRYARRSSRQAMTAGTSKETVPQVSIFSMEIVAALKRHVAPVFMAQQLAGEINPRVAAVAHTTPTFSAVPGIESDQGDFVFVRRETAAETGQVTTNDAVPPATDVRRTNGAAGTRPAGGAGTPQSTPQTSTPTQPRTDAAPVQRNNSAPSGAPSGGSGKFGNIGSTDAPAAPASGGASTGAGTPGKAPGTGAATSRTAAACDGGVSSGCVLKGLNLEYGRSGVAQNVPQAIGQYRLACDAQDPDGCMNLGRMYDSPHQGISMDRGKARQYFATACAGNVAYACTAIGLAASKGEGGPVDDKKAVVMFGKGCDNGDIQGCGMLGLSYATGRGIGQDEARGRSFLTVGCNGKDSTSCNALGAMYADGRGGAVRDSSRAMTFWRTACTGTPSIAEACGNLGAGYLKGSGVMRDDVRAGSFLSQGCEGRYATACTQLATMYETGTSVTAKSVTRAADFYKRGCDGGDQKACAWITANPQPPKK